MRCAGIAALLLLMFGLGEIAVAVEPMPKLTLRVGGACYQVALYNNPSARALLELLPMDIEMRDLNGNEKYHYLPDELPSEDERPGDIRTGELMLYASDCLVLFYQDLSSSYSYTRLGYIEDSTGLREALGGGDVPVSFYVDAEAQ